MIAVVLARAGSKRLPGKNMMEVGGIALVGRAILCGLAAGIDVVLSTDIAEAMEHGRRLGAVVVERPAALATGTATPEATALHAISAVPRTNWDDIIILLQPTSPLRAPEDVEATLRAFDGRGAFTVRRSRPQEPNGAVYVTTGSRLLAGHKFAADDSIRVPMPDWRSVDVDTLADLTRARRVYACARKSA